METILIDAICSHLNISYLVINTAGRERVITLIDQQKGKCSFCNFHLLKCNWLGVHWGLSRSVNTASSKDRGKKSDASYLSPAVNIRKEVELC